MSKTKGSVILAAGVLFLAIALFAKGAYFQKNGNGQALPPAIKTKLFQMKNPPFDFTFEYLEAWRVSERGYKGDYDMVEIMATGDKDRLVVPGMFITKKALQAGETVATLMASWLKKEGRYEDFTASSPKNFEIGGRKGLRAGYGYKMALPLGVVGAEKVSFKKGQVVVIKGGFSYQITFMGTDEQYNTYKPVFEHLLRTFKFKD
jgi:hypothetical protein